MLICIVRHSRNSTIRGRLNWALAFVRIFLTRSWRRTLTEKRRSKTLRASAETIYKCSWRDSYLTRTSKTNSTLSVIIFPSLCYTPLSTFIDSVTLLVRVNHHIIASKTHHGKHRANQMRYKCPTPGKIDAV